MFKFNQISMDTEEGVSTSQNFIHPGCLFLLYSLAIGLRYSANHKRACTLSIGKSKHLIFTYSTYGIQNRLLLLKFVYNVHIKQNVIFMLTNGRLISRKDLQAANIIIFTDMFSKKKTPL